MTRRLVFATILASAVACAGVWPFAKKEKAAAKPVASSKADKPAKTKASKEAVQGYETLYTKGSIAAIPQYTAGKLDLTNKTSLTFHYGKPTWTLPYAKIASIEVADKRPNDYIHVPYLMKKKRIFTINFDNDKGVRQNMELELGLEAALEALPVLEERSGKAAVVEGQQTEGWWGDRYWKTASNSQVWEDAANGSRPKAVAQAKE